MVLSPPPQILVVEHDDATRDTYARILSLQGFHVHAIAGARNALDHMRTNPPDLVITDLSMPEVDGLTLLQRIRSEKEFQHVPVAIVTGNYFVEPSMRTRVTELHAVIRFKPLWMDDLVTLVQQLLSEPSRGASDLAADAHGEDDRP